ncbi:uncharacterized protein EI90DRAFT_2058752 [Cantharellus anzutake]|uniref:uncharacterized protein n=1 Tax=Cantharellus anzutake TaxID=1750568 RepID=UPI0019060C2B|nr:uncharacterized protein EI90DRAFT_2058752 [Cantharellus anzutake]KAF8340395.1 hypothetical protein EI90DRAFT_2058752 [Cantharellus anzutake]
MGGLQISHLRLERRKFITSLTPITPRHIPPTQRLRGPLVNYPPLPPIGEMLPGTAPQSGNFPYQSYSDIQGSVHVHGPASTFPPGYPSGLQPPLPYEFPHPHTPVALPSAQQYVGPTQSSAEPQQVVEQRYNPQLQYTQPSQYPPPGPYILPESQSDEPTDDDGHETPTHQ